MKTATNTMEVTVSRQIQGAPEAVYDAWLNPNSPGGLWFGVERAILNVAVDGLFFHSVKHEGRSWAHYGRFIRLDRGRTIEHTWMSEGTRGLESIVTITLEPQEAFPLARTEEVHDRVEPVLPLVEAFVNRAEELLHLPDVHRPPRRLGRIRERLAYALDGGRCLFRVRRHGVRRNFFGAFLVFCLVFTLDQVLASSMARGCCASCG